MEPPFTESVPDTVSEREEVPASRTAAATDAFFLDEGEVKTEERNQTWTPKPNKGNQETASERNRWKFEEGTSGVSSPIDSGVRSPSEAGAISEESGATSIFEHISDTLNGHENKTNSVTPPLNRFPRESARGRTRSAPKKKEVRHSWYSAASRLLFRAAAAAIVCLSLRTFALCMKEGLAATHYHRNISENSLSHIAPVVFHFGENPGFRPRKLPSVPIKGNPVMKQDDGNDFLHVKSGLDSLQNDIESLRSSCSELAVAEYSHRSHDALKQPEGLEGYEPEAPLSGPWGSLMAVKKRMSAPHTLILTVLVLGILLLTLPQSAEKGPRNASLQVSLSSGAATSVPSSDGNTLAAGW